MPLMDTSKLKPLTCPTCGAVLAFNRGELLFHCLHGHRYSSDALDAALRQGVSQQLQRVIRQLQESHLILHALAAQGLIADTSDSEALALAKRIAASLPTPSPNNNP